MPVVIVSRNREDIYSFLKVSDFLTLLQYAMEGGWMGQQQLPKIRKKSKKVSIEETAHFAFSKKEQVRKKKK